ncbi:hypothetical protein [Cloacibacillus evryensis]|uniref:hypothetical protein n=1 Tax=Cloacibacillus evryensis TaxID=508460 RepID=UPI0004B1F40B|nr:hypothetical protein [Cloacibacillus evryensis]
MSTREISKDERITKEIRRLLKIFKALPMKRRAVLDGLIKRAAYMRITLEDMEADLNENGFVEMFSQSEKLDPYERERPIARQYNAVNKNYQNVMKMLNDALKAEPDEKPGGDDFQNFLQEREQ